jgi:hypothetical protein
MNVIDEQVIHSKFGVGQVLSNDDGRIIVLFSDDLGQKVFLYPEAFGHYLKMCNPIIQDIVYAELKLKQDQVAAEKKRKGQLLKEEAAQLAVKKAVPPKPSPRKTKQSKGENLG